MRGECGCCPADCDQVFDAEVLESTHAIIDVVVGGELLFGSEKDAAAAVMDACNVLDAQGLIVFGDTHFEIGEAIKEADGENVEGEAFDDHCGDDTVDSWGGSAGHDDSAYFLSNVDHGFVA